MNEHEWITYSIEKLFETNQNVEESNIGQNEDNFNQNDKPSEEGQYELQDILENLNEPINLIDSSAFQLDSRFFKLEIQKEYKVLTFENKNVQAIFNILINFIGLGDSGQQ